MIAIGEGYCEDKMLATVQNWEAFASDYEPRNKVSKSPSPLRVLEIDVLVDCRFTDVIKVFGE